MEGQNLNIVHRKRRTETHVVGVIVKGYGDATGALKHQIPHLAKYIQDIKNYHPATLNLFMSVPIYFERPSITTPKIKWHEDYNEESFELIHCKVLYLDKSDIEQEIEGLVYRPSESPHTYNDSRLEIILKWHDNNLYSGKKVTVSFYNPCGDDYSFVSIIR